MNLDEKMVENITKQTYEAQNQQLRFFAKIDITTKLKILEHQKPLFHKLKSIYGEIDNAILTLSSLILAIESIKKEIDDFNLNCIKLRSKNLKKRVKREKLLGYWAIVKTLKNQENMSFRQIAQYLKKYHRFDVAHSTIFELWHELENKKILGDNNAK